MARSYFPGDNIIVAAGSGSPANVTLAPGAEFTVYSAETGGSQYTSLLAADGTTSLPVNGNGKPYADANGKPPGLYGPDGVNTVMWRDINGTRYPMFPSTDLAGLLTNGAKTNVANTFSTAQTFTSGTATAFSTAPTVSGNAVAHAGNLATLMATSSILGAFLNATGMPYYIYVNPTTGVWASSGARVVPTGFTGRVIWDSQSYQGASQPAGIIDGDFWDERVA